MQYMSVEGCFCKTNQINKYNLLLVLFRKKANISSIIKEVCTIAVLKMHFILTYLQNVYIPI